MCVCVSVCVWEREVEKDRKRGKERHREREGVREREWVCERVCTYTYGGHSHVYSRCARKEKRSSMFVSHYVCKRDQVCLCRSSMFVWSSMCVPHPPPPAYLAQPRPWEEYKTFPWHNPAAPSFQTQTQSGSGAWAAPVGTQGCHVLLRSRCPRAATPCWGTCRMSLCACTWKATSRAFHTAHSKQ